MQYVILGKPRTSDGKSSMKIGIKTNEGLNISTDFIGYPLPNVSWTFKSNSTNNGILIPNANTTVLRLNVSAIRTLYVKSTLTEEEFGSYIVTAHSSAGSSEFIFEVIPESKHLFFILHSYKYSLSSKLQMSFYNKLFKL